MATEKRNLLKGDFSKKNALLFALAVLVTTVLWNLPTSSFGIEGLTVIQQRIIAVFALATILWVTEAISPWATSVSLIGLLLFTTSDNAFHFFRSGIEKEELLDHSALMATFADPIIISSSAVSSSLSQQQSRDLTCFWHALCLSLSATRARMCSSALSSSPAYSQCSSATPLQLR